MDESKIIKKAFTFIENQGENVSQGDRVTFTQLYRRNVSQVFYYLYSRVQNVADAEDLTSQTFLAALENLSKLHDMGKFTPWVFTIARNKSLDFFRNSQRRPIVEYNEELDQMKVGEMGLSQGDQDRLDELEHLISHLNAREQEYLRLRIIAELPFAEIAIILNESETRIKKKYYRLLERLQAQVEK